MRADGFPMGPFELMDLAGLDVNLAAATAIWERLGRPDRLRPSPIQAELVAAGELGRKAGQGFYHYEDGRRMAVAARFADAGTTSVSPPGEITTRITAAITREARSALADGVAPADDMALALRLGAAHPRNLVR
jgi:3-hydroxyacyl-CoA dehydrogenase